MPAASRRPLNIGYALAPLLTVRRRTVTIDFFDLCNMASSDQLFARFGKSCPAGTVLFREGEVGDRMFVVQSGKVRISKQGRDGEKTLAVLGPGEFLGEMAILNNKPRTGTAEVVEDARLLVIDGRTFEAMVVGNAEIAVRLIKKLSRRLDAASSLIDVLMRRDPRARVVLGLAREAAQQGAPPDGSPTVVQVDRDALATQLGLLRDEVDGVIPRLLRLGLVEEVPEGFAVPDVARLYEFLDFLDTRGATGGG
jgi:CRP/FNR family transcriptional regulator, cyclic AMP receptor protein